MQQRLGLDWLQDMYSARGHHQLCVSFNGCSEIKPENTFFFFFSLPDAKTRRSNTETLDDGGGGGFRRTKHCQNDQLVVGIIIRAIFFLTFF